MAKSPIGSRSQVLTADPLMNPNSAWFFLHVNNVSGEVVFHGVGFPNLAHLTIIAEGGNPGFHDLCINPLSIPYQSLYPSSLEVMLKAVLINNFVLWYGGAWLPQFLLPMSHGNNNSKIFQSWRISPHHIMPTACTYTMSVGQWGQGSKVKVQNPTRQSTQQQSIYRHNKSAGLIRYTQCH